MGQEALQQLDPLVNGRCDSGGGGKVHAVAPRSTKALLLED